MEIPPIICTFFAIAPYFLGSATSFSYLSTVSCRYRQVKLQKTCQKKLIFALLLLPYSALIPFLLNNWILIDGLSQWRDFCLYFNSSHLEPFLFSFVIFCLLLSLVFQMTLSLKLYKHLSNHFKTISANLRSSNRSALERLTTERSILKAVLIQGLCPVIFTVPVVIRAAYDLVFFYRQFSIFGHRARALTVFLYSCNPLLDAWAVLVLMIPYSRARKMAIGKIWQKIQH